MATHVESTVDSRGHIADRGQYRPISCRQEAEGDREIARTKGDEDRCLVQALRLGEPGAAEQLVGTYGTRAYRLAIRITGNEQDAEEVVQDAFWAVTRKIDGFRGEAALGSWLYRIVANTAYQKLRGRRSRRFEVSLDDALPFFDKDGQHVGPTSDWSARLEDRSVQPELRMTLSAAIEDLPTAVRIVVVLHDVEGLSNREIAGSLGISIPNVKSRVHRGRLALRKRLGSAVLATSAPATRKTRHADGEPEVTR